MGKQTVESKSNQMSGAKTNPLRNEKVFVRFVPKNDSLPKGHVLSGGKADGSYISLCVPVLRSTGAYKNILTNDEKDYLEEKLGLDSNALSVYKKENNYWDNYRVLITNVKEGLHLDLSDPEDYIKYKVLIANSDIVAPSVKERLERPKATYQFEIVNESEETSMENARMDATMASYKEFGKIEDDNDKMRVLVELLDARPYAINTKPEFFRSRINMLIQSDPRMFLRTITDPLFYTKVILRRAQELGKVTKRGDYYYLAADGSPLCDNGQNPTLEMAAEFLNLPAHQEIKFILESEVNKSKV